MKKLALLLLFLTFGVIPTSVFASIYRLGVRATPQADLNADGKVDIFDYNQLVAEF
jgi:hypothetical protein